MSAMKKLFCYFFVIIVSYNVYLCTKNPTQESSLPETRAIVLPEDSFFKEKKILNEEIDHTIDIYNLSLVDDAINTIEQYILFLKQLKGRAADSIAIIQWLQTKISRSYIINRESIIHPEAILLARLIKKNFTTVNEHHVRYMVNAIRLDELAEQALIDSNLAVLIDVPSSTIATSRFNDAVSCSPRWITNGLVKKLKGNNDDSCIDLKILRRKDSFLKEDSVLADRLFNKNNNHTNHWFSAIVSKIKRYMHF
jgi:hypothetical protein